MIYQLYTIGWNDAEVFIGSFSTLEKAQARVIQMCLHRRTWVELDEIDKPAEERNIVWECN